MDKIKEKILIAEDIIFDIETSRISLEDICFKTRRLARLLGDIDSIKWLKLEINGYSYNDIVSGISDKERFQIAMTHGRGTLEENSDTKKKEEKIWISSISHLETSIGANEIKLNSLKLPDKFEPSKSSIQTEGYYSNVPLKTEFVVEKYQNIIDKISEEQNLIINDIKLKKSILVKIKSSIYDYVLEKYYELKYSNTIQDIFSGMKEEVSVKLIENNSELGIIISSIHDNLNSSSKIDWSNAVHNCRRLLYELSNILYPATDKEIIIGGGKKTILNDENYIIRLKQFIIDKIDSGTHKKILGDHLEYMGNRIGAVYKASTKGSHITIDKKKEAERYVIYTFVLLSDILSLTK